MIQTVVEVVVQAGRIIQTVREEGFEVSRKGEEGPVTRADRQADRYLRESLTALHPAAWLSEETADDPCRLDGDRIWIVDPLDGTKEFVRDLPEYAVSAALVEKGRPVLAVVHNPAFGETFWARRGEGAFRNGEAIQVLEEGALLASRSELDRGEFAPLQEKWRVVACGSIAYKLALVAAGRGTATLSRGPKWEWDVCAGSLLVEEAGGRVTDLYGNPFTFNRPFPKVKGVLAGAPQAYRRLLTRMGQVGASERMAELSP